MNKKSGLADSPFFKQSPPRLEEKSNVEKTPVGETAKSPNGEKTISPNSEIAERRNGEKVNERGKIRQGIDVYKDQMMTLSGMQLDAYRRTGKKPKIGAMVRAALDEYIARKKQEINNSV
jgi:hypothetical protein